MTSNVLILRLSTKCELQPPNAHASVKKAVSVKCMCKTIKKHQFLLKVELHRVLQVKFYATFDSFFLELAKLRNRDPELTCGVLGQVWYLNESIPDLCLHTYFVLTMILLVQVLYEHA